MSTNMKLLQAFGLGFLLTALSYAVGMYLGWITEINILEATAVITSYACVWLCTLQSRWNYPVGIATTALYSVLFYQWGMLALAVFNLYLVFSLIYGWFRWGSDTDTRPVTTIPFVWYGGYASLGLAILGLFLGANLLFNPDGISALNPIDVSLAVASGVAQFMLDNKKLENWIVWAGINIVSIPFFWYNGLTLVAFQYIFFLANTVIAYIAWKRTMVTA